MMKLSPCNIYQEVLEFLLRQEISGLNFPLEPLCTRNGWAVLPVQEFCRKRGFDVAFMLERVLMSNYGAAIHFRDRDKYCIVYNDALEKSEIRWTIAHEIGHIVLRHFERYPDAVSSSGVLRESQYGLFESEANLFARFLLARPVILAESGIIRISDIAERTGLPHEEARRMSLFLKGSFLYMERDEILERQLMERFQIHPDSRAG